jgi:DNA repair exonuclease SbcCD ATPase subunit
VEQQVVEVQGEVGDVAGAAAGEEKKLNEELDRQGSETVPQATVSFEEYVSALEDLQTDVTTILGELRASLDKGLAIPGFEDEATESVEDQRAKVAELQKELKDLEQAQFEATTVSIEGTEETQKKRDELSAAEAELKRTIADTGATFDEFSESNQKSQELVNRLVEEAAGKVRDYADEFGSLDDESTRALEALIRGLEDQNDQFGLTTGALDDFQRQFGVAFDRAKRQQGAFGDELEFTREKAVRVKEEADDLGVRFEAASGDATDAIGETNDALATTIERLGSVQALLVQVGETGKKSFEAITDAL